MNQLARKASKKIKEELARKMDNFTLLVFGSRARGDETPESDLDVLIMVDTLTPGIEDFISRCAWKVGFELDLVIVPIVLKREDIEKGPLKESVFVRTVLKEGIRI